MISAIASLSRQGSDSHQRRHVHTVVCELTTSSGASCYWLVHLRHVRTLQALARLGPCRTPEHLTNLQPLLTQNRQIISEVVIMATQCISSSAMLTQRSPLRAAPSSGRKASSVRTLAVSNQVWQLQ